MPSPSLTEWLKKHNRIVELRLIGNSHLAALKKAMERMQPPNWLSWSAWPVAYSEGQRVPFSAVVDGYVKIEGIACSNARLGRLALGAIRPDHAVYGVVLLPDRVPEPSIEFMRHLQQCGIKFFAIMCPWPHPDDKDEGVDEPRRQAAIEALTTLGIKVVDALQSARDEHGFLKPEYRKWDHKHANVEYGVEMLKHIIETKPWA